MIDYSIPTDLASYDSEDALDDAIVGYLQNLLAERQEFARAILDTGTQADINEALDAVAEVERRISMVQGSRDYRNRSRYEAMRKLQGATDEELRKERIAEMFPAMKSRFSWKAALTALGAWWAIVIVLLVVFGSAT